MHDLAFEQVRDGRQADVRVRPDIDAARNARLEAHRAEVVEENERSDHPTLGERKHASDFESAKVAAAWSMTRSIIKVSRLGRPPTLAPLTAPQGVGQSVGAALLMTCKL